METETLMQCLSRTGALATKTYQRALARTHSLDRQQTDPFHAGRNRNASASVGHKNGNQTRALPHHSFSSCCHRFHHCHAHNKWSTADPNTQSLRYRKSPKKGSVIRHRNPSEYDKGNPEHCNINSTMKKLQEHMDMISLHCECYFDSCPKRHLSRSDRRHLKSFHKGVLHTSSSKKRTRSSSPRRGSKGSSKSTKSKPSPSLKESHKQQKCFQTSGSTTTLSVDSSDSTESVKEYEREQLSSSSPVTDTSEISEIPDSDELKQLLEEADIIVKVNSPFSTNTRTEERDKNISDAGLEDPPEPEESEQSLPVFKDQFSGHTSQLHSFGVPKTLYKLRDSMTLYQTSWHKQIYHGEEKPTDEASEIPNLSESSEGEDSSLALMQEVEGLKTTSEKHVRFGKDEPENYGDQSQNAVNQYTSRVRAKKVGHALGPKVWVQGTSVFPTSAECPSFYQVKKNRKGAKSEACQTDHSQGIVITTRPGRYLVKARPGGQNTTHALNISPGHFVNLIL